MTKVNSKEKLNDNLDLSLCQNNIVLLHAAIASINQTIRDCITLNMKEEPEDKKRVSKAYRGLNSHHNYNSLASLGQTVGGMAQVGLLAYGTQAQLADAVGRLSQASAGTYKDYNQGLIQAYDAHEIEMSRKESEKRIENSKHLENLEERCRESTNAAINRAIEAFQIRG